MLKMLFALGGCQNNNWEKSQDKQEKNSTKKEVNIDEAKKIIKDDKKLEKELTRRNINKDKKIVLYSNKEVDTKIIDKLNELGYKDVSAFKDGMYALAMGWKNICIYDGGWYEWHLKKDTPRKEKGIPKDAPETPKFDY